MEFAAPILYHFLESVDSTNTWVRLNYKAFDLSRLHVVYAAEQTKGKGTHGKSWVSPKEMNIYATFFFSLPAGTLYSTLAAVLSLSIVDTLKPLGFDPAIKWPNDLLLNHKKICGILCELTPIGNELLVILGFGLNVNMPESLCNTIDQPTSSLFVVKNELFSTSDLLKTIALKFQQDLHIYLNDGFIAFTKSYNEYMIYTGYPVFLNNTLLGTAQSVNHLGELVIQSPSGEFLSVTSGSIKI